MDYKNLIKNLQKPTQEMEDKLSFWKNVENEALHKKGRRRKLT